MAFISLKLSSFTSINMRAVVLLCLLHAAFGQPELEGIYTWGGPESIEPPLEEHSACLLNQASCGCCLMQEQAQRMEWFFNITYKEMKKELMKTKTMIDSMRASRSAFSVALNTDDRLNCYGPFSNDKAIVHKHVFINLGDSYNTQTGIFTAPRSGVYSLALTIYASESSDDTNGACANLEVNGQVMSELLEKKTMDYEDSATIVVAKKLEAGAQVTVVLPKGCVICDHKNHFNIFTGFLLYATD